MEYVNFGNRNADDAQGNILCCECGLPIAPNPLNMCIACIRSKVDITEGIPKQGTLHFCRNCERYLQPPSEWVQCALDSRELLALCLKKMKGLKDVKLVDAQFEWTEPHSKRIKVRLTVHGEIMGGTVLQQVFVVEFTVTNQMCDDCHRTEAKDFWRCLVQARQRSENKKTFFYLEQMILKHQAHLNTLGIKQIHGGLDFFYANESHARKMIYFLQTMAPIRTSNSKRLISHDVHSNSYNYKYTFMVEIAPISKDSVVCLPRKVRQQYGNIAPVCLVLKVSNVIHLIDPKSAQIAEISSQAYFREPFEAIFNPKQLVEYVVMDIEAIEKKDRKIFPGQGPISVRHVLCDIWVVKASELGINDNPIHTRTHLGHLLRVGDTVMGYNLAESNANNDVFENLKSEEYPDVILVKKCYGDQITRSNQRAWKLKHLTEDEVGERQNKDYEEFLEDLEEDVEYRQSVNIYRDTTKNPQKSNDVPQISLEEMLEDLAIDDDPMEADEKNEGNGNIH